MLKNGAEYIDKYQDYYEKQYQKHIINNLKKKAANIGGLTLILNDIEMV